MSRIYDLGGRPAGSAAAPTATVGGSTSLDAALTAQLGLTALSLSATSLSAGATIAWAVYGPDASDQTANLITAGADTATPTWAAFSAATGAIAGQWVVAAVVTAGSLSTRYTRRVVVGAEATIGATSTWMYLLRTVELTGVETADWTGSNGAKTLDGIGFLSGNGGGASAFGPVSGSGIRIAPADNKSISSSTRTSPYLTALLTALIPGWEFGDPFAIQWVYNTATQPATNNDSVRAWIGTEAATSTGSTQYECVAYDMSNGSTRTSNVNVKYGATVGGYVDATVQAASSMELLCNGSGCSWGYASADPGTTPPAPGSYPRAKASSTADDYGPLAWVTRAGGVAPAVSATCVAGFTANRASGGTAVDVYLERIHVWCPNAS